MIFSVITRTLINFFPQAIENAWERMVHILFRPFSIEKWLAIGLSAFLAGLLVGGNGFSGVRIPNANGFNRHDQNNTFYQSTHAHHYLVSIQSSLFHLVDDESSTDTAFGKALAGFGVVFLVLIFLVVFTIVILLQILFGWLGSRGQFMFLDNIVRNRAAVSAPWERYGVQANSLFKLFLIYYLSFFVAFILLLIPFFLLLWPLMAHNTTLAAPAIIGLIVLGLVYLVLFIPVAFIYFNFIEFGIPIMFKSGIMAVPALWQVLSLIKHHLGILILYTMLRFFLWIGVVICTVLLCCVCCIGIIPYIGTVALLPALVFIRALSLEFLAQLQPELSVWTVDGAVNPLPPRG